MAVQPKVNVIFVGLEAAAIPPGPSYVDIDPAKANEAFEIAIASLPANGGILYVMPGTLDYVFEKSVVVDKPNVTIDFVGGSTLRFAAQFLSTTPDMFIIEDPGFRCTGAKIVHGITSGNNPIDRSCFLLKADDADISECTFEVRQGDAIFEIRYFSCIRAVLKLGESGYRLGLRVTRNTFVLNVGGFDQELPWIPPGGATTYPMPRGVCCIAIEKARGLIISGNVFRSSGTGVRAACGPALFLVTAEQTVVSANSCRDLRTSAGGTGENRGAIVRMLAGGGEGHHTVLSANVFSEIDSAVVIALDDVNYDYVSSNVFDRIGSASRPCWSVVRALRGAVLGVVSNAFTRITGSPSTDEAAVYLDSLANVTVSGNLFTEVQTGRRAFAVKPGTCSNVQFDSQQAQAGNAT